MGPVVSVSITRSIPLLLVDYQTSRVSSVQQSVFLSLGLYLFCWQTIKPRGYHLSSSQCFYHQVYTSSVGRLLDLEGIICPVVSVSITRSIPLLLVDYQTSRVSSVQQSVFLSLCRYLFCWQTIRPRGYHLFSSQCFYHQVYTSSVGRLLDLEGIICPVVSVSITRSIPLLLVDYQTSRVSSVQQSVFLSLCLYLFCWQTIRPRGYHPPSSQCFYHCVDTSSVGRLLDLEGIICPVVSVSITRSIPLLLVDYQTSRVSSVQQSVFLSLGLYFFCWQTIRPRGYHPPSSQCFYHQVYTSSVGRLLDLEGIICPVVSVSITVSIPLLLVDYQTSRVSSVQQSVFLSLGLYLFCWQTIRPRGYHLSSSQCFYHQVYTSSVGRLLDLEGIICPVVSVSITRSILLLLVDYQTSRVSWAQQSVFLSLGLYLFCWQTIRPRGYHLSISQCFYHQVYISSVGRLLDLEGIIRPVVRCFYHQVYTSSVGRLLYLEGIIHPVVSVSITRSIPLMLVDYQTSRVSSVQQSVFLSLGLYFFCWQTIRPRGYHLSSSQCFYHQVYTSSVGRLLDLEGIICPVVSVSITVSILLLLVNYQTSRVSSVQQSVFLSLGLYLFYWQTIRPRGYHLSSSQCFYHQVYTSSVGRLLDIEGIICPVVSVSITVSIPLLLVDYQTSRVSSTQQSVFLSLCRYLFCWQIIRPRGYHLSSSQCFYHQVYTSSVGRLLDLEGIIRPVVSVSITRSILLLLVDYQTQRVSSTQQSVFLSLGLYLFCWQTIRPRGYHLSSSQCFYHCVDTSSVGRLLDLEGIICPVVSVSITRSIPLLLVDYQTSRVSSVQQSVFLSLVSIPLLLVDYQTSRVSSVQQSVFLSLGLYLFCWQTIRPRGYHGPSSQCFYHQVYTSSVGRLLDLEGIMGPVVSVSITRSILLLLVDYQTSRVSSIQQSVFLSVGLYFFCWQTIRPRVYHGPSSQCFYHQVYTSSVGRLLDLEGIIRPVVSVSITRSILLLLVDYQTSRVSSVQQSVFLSLGLYLFCWQTIRPRGYHLSSSQCFYHQVYTSSVGRLLDLEGIICPVVSVSITRSIPLLLVDYQTSRVSSVQQSVFLSLCRYLFCWQTIRPRGYHLFSSQCFYHQVYTSFVGRLLDLVGIICPVVSVSISVSIPLLLVDYQTSRVSSAQQSVFLSLVSIPLLLVDYQTSRVSSASSQCFYHQVYTSSVGRLLDLEGIICPVVSVSITRSIPLLLVDYQTSRVSSAQQSVFLSLGLYLFCWQTIRPRGYHLPSSQYFYHCVYTSSVGRLLDLEGIIRPVDSVSITVSIPLLLVDYQTSRVSSVQQSVFLSLCLYLFCWQTIRPRGYHPPSSQCFYHQVYTSSVGTLLDLEGIIRPVVSVSITVSIPLLLVDYQTSRVSSVQQSVFLSLGQYLFCWQTIRPRGYHLSSSQCFYHQVYTSSVGRLLDLEGIMGPVVSVSISRSIPLLLVDYQTSRVSWALQSVFLKLGLYLFCWQTIRPRGYHLSSSQCFYHQVYTYSVGRLLDLEGIMGPVVSVSITVSIPLLLVDYQTSRVSSVQQSVFLSLGLYLFCWQTIRPRGYHLSSSQCFYHQVYTSSVGRLLDLEGIICPVVSVSITRSMLLLLVDYQTSRVSWTQQSVFLSLGLYLFCWQTIRPRGYHLSSSQCFYHQVYTSSVGRLLDLEGIICPVVSVSITRSILLLLVDYQTSRVSWAQQSVFLSLGLYLFCWQTIRPRGYHLSSSQCFYHQVYTSSVGRLLDLEGIICQVVSVSITRSIPLLLVDYQTSRVSSVQQSVFLSLGLYLFCWQTIRPRGYHLSSSQCFYHCVDTSSVGRLLDPEGIICSVVSVSITRSIPLLLVDYQTSRVSSVQQLVFLSLGLYLFCWQTIRPRGYHPSSSQCFYHCVYTSSVGRLLDLEGIIHPVVSVSITVSIPLLLVDYQTSRVSSVQQSVFLSLGLYLFCWQTIRPRGYHPSSSQCFYHQVYTSSVGRLLDLEGIIHPVVSVSITRSIPLLLVDYQTSRVSSVQQSVFLSLCRYLFCWQTIRPRGYHLSSSQCFYHQVYTSSVGRLLDLEGIICPVVSVSITRSIPLLLVDYQTSRVSSVQQSVFLSLGLYLFCWQTIRPRGYHGPSSQCFYHQVYTSSVGRLLDLEGIIRQSVFLSLGLYLFCWQTSRVSSVQQSVFLSLGLYLFCWQTIRPREYHPPSSQCFYHQVYTSSVGRLLDLEGIIYPVVSVSITRSILLLLVDYQTSRVSSVQQSVFLSLVSIPLLLVDYQTSRVSSVQQSVFLSLCRYFFCWQTIRPRGYHLSSSQCFYHQVYTSSLVDYQEGIIRVVSVSITRSIPLLLVDYQTSRVSSAQQSVFLSLCLYLFCWQTIRPRGYHLSSSQCFYHCVDTSSVGIRPRGYHLSSSQCFYHQVYTSSVGRLLDLEGIIRPVVSVSLGLYFFCWQTIRPRGYHPPSSQCFYHQVYTSSVGRLLDLEGIICPVVSVSITVSIPLLLVDYQTSRVSSVQQLVFLSLGLYLFCWQTIRPRGYHLSSSQCFYHQVYTSSVGRLLDLEGIICPVVSVSITRSILLLLVDYQTSRVSSAQQSVFLSLGLYLFCWQTIRPRGYHPPSSQCFYHQVYTSSVGRLLDLEGIIYPVVSVSITRSILLLLVDYQTSSVSWAQQSVFLSLGLYLFCWQTIRPRGYHLSSSQCFYHQVYTSFVGRLLDLEGIICPVVSVSITRSIPLLFVDYQTSRVSSVQQSVFLSLGLYFFCWQTIRPRGYHLSSSQCFYHQVYTSSVGRLLDLEGIICPVVSVSITVSIPLLLVDYQTSRVSSVQQLVFLSLGLYLFCWQTIRPRGYHLSSSQCFYLCVYTSSVGRLLDLEGIIRPVVSVSITRSIPLLLVDYQTSRVSSASSQCFYHQVYTSSVGRLLDLEGIICPVVSVSITRSIPLLLVDYQTSRVSSAQQSVFLSLGLYFFCWQTIKPRGYHLPSSQYFYHCVYTSSVGRLLDLEGIIRPVDSVSITVSIPLLLVDYQTSRVSSVQQSVFLSLCLYLFCWQTIRPRGYHPPSSQCFYHQVYTSSVGTLLYLEGIIRPVVSVSITVSIPLLLVDYQTSRVSSVQQSVFLSLGQYLFCWQTIRPRGYHLSSSQCFYHQVYTSSVGRLLDLEGIMGPVVSVSITRSIPLLLVDYQTSRVSWALQSVFLKLGLYLFCWQTIRPRGYHLSSSQCFYHQVYTYSVGRLLDLEGIMGPVVSVSITVSIPLLLVDYQTSRVSSVQQSVFLSLGLYLFCWQTIRPRGYHLSSSQCFYHQVYTSSVGRLLDLEGIICPVVSVSITRSMLLLLVDYQTSRVSWTQQSVFLSLGLYLFCWQTIRPRGYHGPSSQCFYHQVYTSSVGKLLDLEGIICPVVSVSITRSILLVLVDYQTSRVSWAQQSVFLSLGLYLFCWQTIRPRGYHLSSSQCFYHQVYTSSVGRLLNLEGIICQVVSVSITRSILLLLVDYQTSRVSSVQQSVFLSLGLYLFCWQTIRPRGYHLSSSQCFYHCVDTSSVGRLLDPEGIICSVVSVSITRSIPLLLVDYQTSRVSSVQQLVFLSLGLYLFCWQTIRPRGYHLSSSQCFYHCVYTSSVGRLLDLEGIIHPVVSVSITVSIPLLLVDYQTSRVSSVQQSVFLSLGLYLFCWQTIRPRGYHPSSSQCFYHQVYTSSVGRLLDLEGIIHPVVSVSITRSIPLLLVDYQTSRVSSVQQSVFLSLCRYLFCWQTIRPRGYHLSSSQCFYHQVYTSSVGRLLDLEGIICPVVSVSITRSIPLLLVDYQTSRVSSVQQSVFLSLGLYFFCWQTIRPRGYHGPSSQCFYHQVYTSSVGRLLDLEGIICPVVSVSITRSIPLMLAYYQTSRVSSVQQSVFLSLGLYLFCWQTIFLEGIIHPVVSVSITRSIPLMLVDYQTSRVSSVQQSVFLSLGLYFFCWQTIRPRGYHLSSSQCFYHQVYTSSVGRLLDLEGIICPVVSVSITVSILLLLVNYQTSRVSSVQQSVFLSLGLYLFYWQTIRPRGYHLSSSLLDLEGIICPVVSVSITVSIPLLLVDYQTSRVSSTQQSVFLSLCRYLFCWQIIRPRGYHLSSSQCFYHQVYTSSVGRLLDLEGIIRPVVSVSITRSIPLLLVDYQT